MRWPALHFKILPPYKVTVIKSFKIYNSWNSFRNDIDNIKSNLTRHAETLSLFSKP